MTQALERLAGGPISWGVCEVPGWGAMLPPDRVLGEMASLGLTATEAGPDGYLGHDADAIVRLLERHGLRLLGGFLPVVLHDPARHAESVLAAHRVGALFEEAGASFLVSAVVAELDWSPPSPLSDTQWRSLLEGLGRLDETAAEHGITHVVHPHWGTQLERHDDVARILDESDVLLCLDTGHLVLGGTDPVWLVRSFPERVGHVHLKDVDSAVAEELRGGSRTLVT